MFLFIFMNLKSIYWSLQMFKVWCVWSIDMTDVRITEIENTSFEMIVYLQLIHTYANVCVLQVYKIKKIKQIHINSLKIWLHNNKRNIT